MFEYYIQTLYYIIWVYIFNICWIEYMFYMGIYVLIVHLLVHIKIVVVH